MLNLETPLQPTEALLVKLIRTGELLVVSQVNESGGLCDCCKDHRVVRGNVEILKRIDLKDSDNGSL